MAVHGRNRGGHEAVHVHISCGAAKGGATLHVHILQHPRSTAPHLLF